FFSSRRRHTRSDRDWSSDVCSSDLSYVLLLSPPTCEPETGDHAVPVEIAAAQPPAAVEVFRGDLIDADDILFAPDGMTGNLLDDGRLPFDVGIGAGISLTGPVGGLA